jgi:hypothetical protein
MRLHRARTLRAKITSVKRIRFTIERLARGIKLVSDAEGLARGTAITRFRFEKNCTLRFRLCMSICDYFTNMLLEYTDDHALDLR